MNRLSTYDTRFDAVTRPAVLTAQAFEGAAAAQMERMLADLRRVYRERNEALQELERAHHESLLRLAAAAELRDDETGVHITRMGYLAEALALAAGLDSDTARMLRLAAPMHDIGKIGVPDNVLKKPGPLTDAERAQMMQHPRMGADILGRSRMGLFTLAAEVALTHHERWDGAGYPYGLKGRQIPLTGRIVAIVDFFDALTMDRCYRKALSDERAVGMLNEQAGKAFDPDLVKVFMRQLPRMVELRNWVNRMQPEFAVIDSLEPCAPVRAGAPDLLS